MSNEVLLFSHRCSLLGILHSYNVVIPQLVLEPLNHTIQDFQRRILDTVNFVEEEGNVEFHSLQMKDLKTLNKNLYQFLSPIMQLIEFLVHFSMLKSHIFAQFLQDRMRLQQPTATVVPCAASTLFAGFEGVMPNPARDVSAEHSEDSVCTMKVSWTFCTKSFTYSAKAAHDVQYY